GHLVSVTSPDGAGVGGWKKQLLQVRSIGTNWDTQAVSLVVRDLNNTEIHDMLASQTWLFEGDGDSPVTLAAYPSGSGGDKRHAGTNLWLVDSAVLPGTYTFWFDGYVASGVTLTVGLFNMDDAPDTPIAEATITSTTSVAA